ncbi:MAG: type III polyketide synthase [Deltaproteobacteria bacterium]|nr:type III polyketide synthase [Deltaproteobacteria bacterium]
MRIVSVASALPAHIYHQKQITDALVEYWGVRLEAPEILRRIHSRVGVDVRHLAFPLEQYGQFNTWGQANRAWLKVSEELGTKAIDTVLGRAGFVRTDVDALYTVSITGVASPSLDARLANCMGLRSDIKRTPIFGLGCVGGAVGLVRAADYLRAFPDQIAVLLSVEVCSLTIQLDDLSIANMISIGLFGDGAVAALMAGGAAAGEGPEILQTKSVFYPQTEDMMGWDISEKGFRVILSPKLPELIRSRFAADVDAFLNQQGLSREDVGSWVIHPGGPKILEAVETALGLCNGELEASWECLSHCGNLSSGSVLKVLEEVIAWRHPQPGTFGVIAAMGPGFCAELLLVRW